MTAQPSVQEQVRLYTVADLETMSDDGTRRELIEGELIEMPGAKPDHNLVAFVMAKLLDTFASKIQSGLVIPELGCQLTRNPDTLLFPDVAYISFERLGNHDMREYITVAPDLAIEIISPSNRCKEIEDKIDWYLEYGARLIWVVYTRSRKVHVYSTDKPFQVVKRDGVLDGGDVLPGFSLKLVDLFQTN
ncbi:MAG: Uma2 family endonuclease [Aggregatilineales bacterium]